MSIGKMKNVKKVFFQAVDVKKGNFKKPTHVEIFIIHDKPVRLRSVSCQDALPDNAHSVPAA